MSIIDIILVSELGKYGLINIKQKKTRFETGNSNDIITTPFSGYTLNNASLILL